jgi:hypothetical protein
VPTLVHFRAPPRAVVTHRPHVPSRSVTEFCRPSA